MPARARRGRSCCESSTRTQALIGLDAARHARGRHASASRTGFHALLRRRARHRPDRLGQVDHALRARSTRSTRPSATSSRSRTRSSTRSAGINQMQVNPKAGLTFARGLRSILRADPDVIMVGEIRDERDRADRDRVGAHRPPRALHAAHQRRAVGDHAPHRDGHRAVPDRLGARLRGRAAPRAAALHPLQEAHDARAASLEKAGFNVAFDLEAYEPEGCSRCGCSGYKGRRRPLRGDGRSARRSAS